MLYTIADIEWSSGLPLTPAETRAGLFRTREAAGRVAAGRPTLAVALRFDEVRGMVVAQPPAARTLPGGWTAPAVVNDRGGVVVFSTIPAALVKLVGPASIRLHGAHAGATPAAPHAPAGGGVTPGAARGDGRSWSSRPGRG